MRRREFIGLVAGAAAAWTSADVFAAQKSPMARIGFLGTGPLPLIECCADPECKSPRRDAYQNPKSGSSAGFGPFQWLLVDLHALGWHEGDNLHFEGRFSKLGDPASLPRLAAELVALRPDVLIAVGSDVTKALQAVTSDIPIVFMSSSDPVGYAKPSLVALMQSAEQMGIKVEPLEVRGPSDLDRVFAATARSEAVLVKWLALTQAHRSQIAELAVRYQLPSVYEVREYVAAGGLMSYGLDYRESWRRGATFVDRILRGAQPKDLPVEQASKFELVINLKTAKALGITVPPMLLARADEVIE